MTIHFVMRGEGGTNFCVSHWSYLAVLELIDQFRTKYLLNGMTMLDYK